jgi:hypothetical protein
MATEINKIKPRVRTRKTAPASPVDPSITPQMKELTRTVFVENKQKNEHTRLHDKARKDLFGMMENAKQSGFRLETTDETNQAIILDVSVSTPPADYIDVQKLLGLVYPSVAAAVAKLPEEDRKRFYGTVSATKSAVENHSGKQVAIQSTSTGTGTRNVFVTAAK